MPSVGLDPAALLQSVSSFYNHSTPNHPTSGRFVGRENLSNSLNNGLSASLTARSYSKTSMAMEFTSDDGDTVSLSYEALEYSELAMNLQTETDPEKIKELASYIKNEFQSLKNSLLKSLFGIEVPAASKVQPQEQMELPEYWSAENTSTRIVEFAVSFYGVVKTSGEEYLNQIKNAIDDGFKQAKEILGELPEKTASLIKDTYGLVMQKLDSWSLENSITVSA